MNEVALQLALTAWSHYKKWRSNKPKRIVVITNVVLSIVSLAVYIAVAPENANAVLYRGLLLDLPYVALPLLTLALFGRWLVRIGRQVIDGDGTPIRLLSRRTVLNVSAVLLVNVLWVLCTYRLAAYGTYRMYAHFTPRAELIASNVDAVRYTARHIAFKDMENSISAATQEVLFENTLPLVTDGHFGFISPITPDGLQQTFLGMDPGFVVFDDRPGGSPPPRLVEQPFVIGQGMLWRDSLERQVYLSDWFAVYEHPHYVRLNGAPRDTYTAVVPKIKYRWLLFPYWAGDVLVHANGTIETISAADAVKDARLTGQWIAPQSLARKYVALQNFAVGFFESLFRVPGKLEIPELPGENQFPLLTPGADGHIYHLVATKAEGAGAGLYRMYFVSAWDFSKTYYQFSSASQVYGPTAAMNRVQNLPGYNWYRESEKGQSGNMIATEPVYVLRASDKHLFWKFSITNKLYAGTSAVAVVDGTNLDRIGDYPRKERASYQDWLHGVVVAKKAPSLKERLRAVKDALRRVEAMVRSIEEGVQ